MTVKVLQLGTSQIAGLLTTQIAGLTAVQITSGTSISDFAAIANGVIDDQQIVRYRGGAAVQAGIIFTGSIAANGATSITSFTLLSPSTASISAITAGMLVSGPGLAPGTRVLTATGTTITLDRASYSAATTQKYVAVGGKLSGGVNQYILTVPNRGTLQILPGDVLALDNLGFPYLIPGNSVSFNSGGANSGAPFLLT
jgi:hypothetical protein